MNKYLQSLTLTALLGTSLLVSCPVQAADEASQVLMLRRVFSAPVEYWPDILKKSTHLIDKSFFERVEQRMKWSIDNGQIEDAMRFAYVGDLAGNIVDRKKNYRMQMSQLFRKLGNFSLAIDLINNVCVFEPDNKEALFYKASLLQDSGDNVDSYPIYKQLAQDNYKRSECYYRMALLELQRDEIEEARDHLRECLKLDSKHALARKSLDQLERALAKATFIPKDDIQGSGLPIANLKDVPISTSDSSKALSLAHQGDSALKEGSITQAQEFYEQSLALDKNSAPALMGSGIVSYRQGDLEGAIRNFQAASQKFTTGNADLEHYLGCCYELRYDLKKDKSDLEKAQKHFEKCQELNPQHELVEWDLKRIYKKD
ncbi:tetratricopeptide repeat protein [bacterium]|nr:tetratricopeptide repeat protein [bacterium]